MASTWAKHWQDALFRRFMLTKLLLLKHVFPIRLPLALRSFDAIFFVFWVLTFSWFCFLVLLRLETVAC